MKFGKRLRDQVEETLPDWRNKFLSYKELKKRLKSLSSAEDAEDDAHTNVDEHQDVNEASTRKREEYFVRLLNEELEKFNNFFMEKEEEFVIRMQVLKEEAERLKERCPGGDLNTCGDCSEEVNDVRKMMVALHGEMVLLENYSALNYTGLVKILKKHDKRTGLFLRYPFTSNCLRQPFLTTEILSKLVKDCETNLQAVFPTHSSACSQASDRTCGVNSAEADNCCDSGPNSPDSDSRQGDESPAADDAEAVYRCTLNALKSLQEIRGSSKTPHPLLAEVGCENAGPCRKAKDSESGAGLQKTCASRQRKVHAAGSTSSDRKDKEGIPGTSC